jgi:hypothetical protein
MAGRPSPSNRPRATGRTVVLCTVALALAVGGGSLLWLRITQVQQGAVSPDVPTGVKRNPAARARGAVVTISGQDSHPRAAYDPASGTVTVTFQSKYYDAKHTAALNRQYLATEGRLIVQLVLYNDPDVGTAVAGLYDGRRLLATVTGAQGDAYNDYRVEYGRGLP